MNIRDRQVLEKEALAIMASQGRASESEAARQRITDALREIWPGFSHRSIAPDVADYFERLFPIAPRDRVFLARRYIYPILEGSPG